MNLIDKLIDARQITDQTMNRSDIPLFNLPDFRGWPESLLGPSASLFRGNMFPITPNQLSRSLKISSSNGLDFISGIMSKDGEIDKSTEEEDFCEKCQKKFCNKYYLKKHKIEVHKLEIDMENMIENANLSNETQQKLPLFRPSPFSPLFNSSFSNFLLQKPMPPMFGNMLLPQSSLQQSSQVNSEFNSSSSSILSQSVFRSSQAGSMLNPVDLLTSGHNPFPMVISPEESSKLPNLATSIFNEVRNSFIKLPIETKPLFNLNMLDNGFQDSNRTLSQSITCTICNIQLTGGESVFLDHLYNCHNNERTANHSPNSRIPPKKDSPMSSVTNGDTYISPFDAFKSSMAAAKLADRVTCDICHKDLCNKYFLRTHKLKLHGIQTIDSNGRSGNRKEKGIYDRCPPQFDQLTTNTNFLKSPFPRSSLPEHLLAATMFQNTLPTPVSPQQGCFCPICKRLISLPYFLPLHMWNVHGVGMRNPNTFLPPVSEDRPNIDPSPLEHSFLPIGIQSKISQTLFPLPFGGNGLDTSSIGSKWYRKSPNQMRVRCDICDKWICNKYFLRTHKLNKHGLTDSGSNSDSVSRGFFVDSSSGPNTSTVNIESLPSLTQISNLAAYCDNSPIDLSASQTRDNGYIKGTNPPTIDLSKNNVSKFSCSSIMSNLNLRSVWNTGLGIKWPLRLSLNQINNSSLAANCTSNTTPLDLSLKFHNDNKRTAKHCHTSVRNSLITSTAKKLKIKYQKIYRSRLCQKACQVSQNKSTFLNSFPSSSRKSECFNCPLCGKELQDAPRFLQHLTQFHDMVLPGNHSGPSISSNKF